MSKLPGNQVMNSSISIPFLLKIFLRLKLRLQGGDYQAQSCPISLLLMRPRIALSGSPTHLLLEVLGTSFPHLTFSKSDGDPVHKLPWS